MALQDADNAAKFNTRQECWDWINQRVVRFKLKMVPAMTPDGKSTFAPEKCDGQILNTLAEDFKPGHTDEPLKVYAEPVQQGEVWMAAMRLR